MVGFENSYCTVCLYGQCPIKMVERLFAEEHDKAIFEGIRGKIMATQLPLNYDWYIPDRIFIVQPVGLLTINQLEAMEERVITVLHEPHRLTPVHLIFDATQVWLDSHIKWSHLERCSVRFYRHPLTASVLTVTGMNRCYTFIADSIGQILSRSTRQGRAMRTLNEALRFAACIDPSLPLVNV
jgi:hypothetical protein